MFSIVMPYYNNIEVVDRSIKSVLGQEYNDFELIIVDDGSQDNVKELIDTYCDNRIKYYYQNNSGVSAARNRAIAMSTGEWICFLDSDDEWFPNHLLEIKKMQDMYKNSDFFLTSHRRKGNTVYDSNVLLKDESSDSEIIVLSDFIEFSIRKPGVIHTNSVCIRKKLIEKCGCFAKDVNKGEDTDLWYRCSLYTDVIVSRKITTVYNRDNSFLTKNKKFNYEWIFLSREEYLLNDKEIPDKKKYSLKKFYQKYYLSACKHLIADGDKKKLKILLKKLKGNVFSDYKNEYMLICFLACFPAFFSSRVVSTLYKKKESKY